MSIDTLTLDKTENKNGKQGAFAKLGYTNEGSKKLVKSLNLLMANYSVHYQKLRNYHWNVQGQDFFDIHEQFEEQYNTAKVSIDEIAERVRVFGHTPFSTMKEFLDNSEIKETGTDLTAMEMVHEILRDYQVLVDHMYSVLDVAVEQGDMGTEDLIKGFVYKMEKYHWMMTAFSSKK